MTVLIVDGKKIYVELDPRKPLLEVLHTRLELIGTKKGCDQGPAGIVAAFGDPCYRHLISPSPGERTGANALLLDWEDHER
jgi:hypothetical protein